MEKSLRALHRVPHPRWNLMATGLLVVLAGLELARYGQPAQGLLGGGVLVGLLAWTMRWRARRPSWFLPWAYAFSAAAIALPPLLDGQWAPLLQAGAGVVVVGVLFSGDWVDRLLGVPADTPPLPPET